GFPPIDEGEFPIKILLPRLRDCHSEEPDLWFAACPRHPDEKAVLSIIEAADRTLWLFCHSSCDCTDEQIMAAIGLTEQHLQPSDLALENEKIARLLRRTRQIAVSHEVPEDIVRER